MTNQPDCTDGVRPSPSGEAVAVTIFVPVEHPLLKLKAALPWEAITQVMVAAWRAAGKNVDGGPGQPWPVGLYVPLVVLQVVRRLNSREMEWYAAESAVARVFCDLEGEAGFAIRDHSNVARALKALGAEGMEAVNRLVVREAVRLGFANPERVSGDTTVQELPIGYPHEAGILRGVAERCRRAAERLRKAAVAGVERVVEAGREVLRSVKEYHLFAKTQAERDAVLERVVTQTETLIDRTRRLAEQVRTDTSRMVAGAVETFDRMAAFTHRLLPQIQHWRETGRVATGKLLHAGIPEARAYVRNKAGKAVEFGLKYLIGRMGGGYLLGERVTQHSDTTMPVKTLALYRRTLGPSATPDLIVFDRGGHSSGTLAKLHKAGIPKIGIQPKGQAPWPVAEADRESVTTERARTEGSIGTLKSSAYGFNRPKERSLDSLLRAGQQSFLALNLNLFLKDLTLPNRPERKAAL